MFSRLRPTLLFLLLFLGLAFLLTWPLPLHLATHAPVDGSDDPAILWNLWWVGHSLAELRQSPFTSAWMFWPIGINLVFYTLTTLNGLLSLPLQLAAGIVPANSFIIYFELVMGAFGAWLYARWVLAYHPESAPFTRRVRDTIAVVAAVLFAFSTSKWIFLSLGQFNIAASHWLPFAMLYLSRMWVAPSLRRAVREATLCAFFVLCTGWTEFTYASFFIQLAALLWAWLMLAGLKSRAVAEVRRFNLAVVALGALFLLGMAPILVLMVQDMRVNGDFLAEGLGFSNIFSNDVVGFFVPGDQHPLFGKWVSEALNFSYLNFAFVGWVTLALVAMALIHPRTRGRVIFWALFAAILGVLSLGPTLRINGREWDLPLPFDLLLQIPFVKANRYPGRYSVIIMLCLGMAAMWGVAALLMWMREKRPMPRYALIGIIVGLILFEHLGAPLPLSDYRVPPIYSALRTRPGGAVLDIPLAWRNGFRVTGTQSADFMFAQAFQSAHAKRLLSGNTSRNPEFKFQYFTELPVINSLLALETGYSLPPTRAAQEQPIAADLLRLLDVRDIVIRTSDGSNPAINPQATLPYLEALLVTERWYEDEDYRGLTIIPSPVPSSVSWNAHHPLARLFFAEGWSALPPLDDDRTTLNFPVAVYAEQSETRLFLPEIAGAGDWMLTFTATVPLEGETPVTILLANPIGGSPVEIAAPTLIGGTHAYSIPIPATAPRAPLTALIFRFRASHAIMAFPDAPTPYSLLVESAALPVGDFAHIYLNGRDYGGTQTGYYAALINPDGTLYAAEHFDTFNDPAASPALATFLNNAPDSTLLALAVADTASGQEGTGGLRLGDDVFIALTAYGASEVSDMRGRYGVSHAFIGIKGQEIAREDASDIRPARVTNGLPVHTPTAAVQFEGFVLE